MTEQQTPVMDAPSVPTPPAPPQKAPAKKKKRKKIIKNIIVAIIVLALLAVAAFLVWKFVFTEKESGPKGEPIYDYASIGSIVSTVRGGGSSNAKDSATITLAAAGIVQDVYVTQGQVVNAGDPLYSITSPAAEEALAAAKESYQKLQESMNDLLREMSELQKSRSDLTITAPHSGKLMDVSGIKMGDPLTGGTKIATLVDDTKLKLSLYYSYAYENDISVGQTAQISIPATMTTRTGTVEAINKVRRITQEGGVTFEVIFALDNPGTLTEGMSATAELTDAAGAPIYPYEGGTFTYYQTSTIATKASGPVEQLASLMNYGDVTAGQVLVVQGTNDIDEQIRAKQEQITAAQKTLDDAAKKVTDEEKNLQNFAATAPISGTIISLSPNLVVGGEVDSGLSAITIADNTVMTVNIQVDDRNRQYISEGMSITLTDYNNSYMGIVETVAVQGTNENGITVFPAVVRVDNSMGTLMGGVWLDYEFVAAQSQDCIVLPIQDVRYYTPDGADAPQAVVYIKTDEEPENAIDKTLLPSDMQADIPKGCYVIPVETGLSDDTMVEITSGLQDGDQIYNNTPKEDGSYYNRKAAGSIKG